LVVIMLLVGGLEWSRDKYQVYTQPIYSSSLK